VAPAACLVPPSETHDRDQHRRSDGDWTGTPGGASRTAGTGYTREFAFETPGSYEYYCSVPRANGVAGPFTVIEQ